MRPVVLSSLSIVFLSDKMVGGVAGQMQSVLPSSEDIGSAVGASGSVGGVSALSWARN